MNIVAGLSIVMVACGGGECGPAGTGESTSMMIGPDGGTIAIEDARLTVPAGALASTVTIESTTARPPLDFARWFSPVYKFATIQTLHAADLTLGGVPALSFGIQVTTQPASFTLP